MDYLNMTIKDFLENPPKNEEDIPHKTRTSIVLAAINGMNAGRAHGVLNICKSAVMSQAVFDVDFDYLNENRIIY